jgi:hypothetical protein
MTAQLFRRYEMELYETYEDRDVTTRFDYILGMADKTSPGIRVKIIGENKE